MRKHYSHYLNNLKRIIGVMDQLTAMRVFERVAALGSFARAADTLDMSRAATSSHIAQLERRLGAKLLHRTTRRVSLTPDGARYLQRCQRALAEIDTAHEELRGDRERPQGKLRVDVPHSFGRYLLLPALPAFTQRYPDLALEIRFNDQYVDLEAEQVDVALRGGSLKQARLIAKRVAESRRVTCAAPVYFSRAAVPRTPRDLQQHRLIGYQAGAQSRAIDWHFRHGAGTQRLRLPFALTFNTPEAPIVAALEGSGIIQTIDLLVARLLAEGRLVEILNEYACEGPPLSVVYPRGNQHSIKVRVFAEFTAELLRDWQQRARLPRFAR
jgi:LysR family transcriptional regulator, regulator for bpeEF and oprC